MSVTTASLPDPGGVFTTANHDQINTNTTNLAAATIALQNGSGTPTVYVGPNYIATEGGANNAITGSLSDANGNAIPLAAGLLVFVKLAHTLQAGANTFALNGGTAKNIKSHFNIANNIATAYAATGLIALMYDGTEWVDLAQ